MRETSFIKQNQKDWKEFEDLLNQPKTDPEKLADLYIQATNDLSYARTFYPNRSVRVYLNNLSQKIFLSLYRKKGNAKDRFINLWKEELPLAIYSARKELLTSLVIFLIAVAIGFLSSEADPEFPKIILGDRYVEMTTKNIEGGDPMAVYKDENQLNMFLGITLNNLKVAFGVFVFGFILGIGTIASLLNNGIMVGTFQYFFYEKGLFKESFLTIWLHGTIEISSIIIAGGAGLVLARGLIFPGTFSRLQSFRMSAMKGSKIMIGLVPFFVFAAFIEGFITRYTEVPDFIKAALITISFLFIVFYFVWYPYKKHRSGAVLKDEIPTSVFETPQVGLDKIKLQGQILSESFIIYSRIFMKFIPVLMACAIIYAISAVFVMNRNDIYDNTIFSSIHRLIFYTENSSNLMLFGLNTVMFFIVSLATGFFVSQIISKDLDLGNISSTPRTETIMFQKYLSNNWLRFLAYSLLLNCILLIPSPFSYFLFFPVLPLAFLVNFGIKRENKGEKMFSRYFSGYLNSFVLLIFLCITTSLFFLFLNSPFILFYTQLLEWNLKLDQELLQIISGGILTSVLFLAIGMLYPLFYIAFALQHYSLREKSNAIFLLNRIEEIGLKLNKLGLESEK